MHDLVLSEIDDSGVLTITLNRPQKRNALSLDLMRSLHEHVEAAGENEHARVLVLSGAGPVFCAGMDLVGVVSDVDAMSDMLRLLAETLVSIRRLAVPTVAKVQGAAIGGGCGLMVVCDVAISHPEAKVGYPEVDLGLCPAVVAPWLLRKIGAGRARAMLLAGGTIRGDEAFTKGLVDHLSPRESLDQAARDLAASLSAGGKEALRTTKHWLNELDGSNDERIAARAARLSADVIVGSEAQAMLRARFGV